MSECDFVVESPFLGWLRDKRSGWQFGEQGVLVAIAEALGDNIPQVCVEIGAGDGESLPVTVEPLSVKGWKTELYEIDDERRGRLEKKFPDASIHREFASVFMKIIGVMVIDIDGEDSVELRKAVGGCVDVIMVEHMDRHVPLPSTAPDPLPHWALGLVLKDGFVLQDTHHVLDAIAHEAGYERVCMTRVNSIFVRRELLPFLYRQMEPA